MTQPLKFLAGIDAGGTTFKCGLADDSGHLIAKERFQTADPQQTIEACADFLRSAASERGGEIASLGIASFGPVDVDPKSGSYGTILNTPKPGWSGENLKVTFETLLNVPVFVDTDVNGALLAELNDGAAAGTNSAAYVTIGTGIGAGIYSGGKLVGKPQHPEFGHIMVARHTDDDFAGACSFHSDCLEGLASAPAFTARFGDPKALPQDHQGWSILANYLAQACWSLSLSFRPERILMGGGLMLAPHILAKIRSQYLDLSGGYLSEDQQSVDILIARPAHGDDAGLLGAIFLARQS